MRVLIAADHAGVELKQYLVEYLIKDGVLITDFGTNIPRSTTSIDVLKQAGSAGRFVAAWNYIDTMNTGDYLEIIWQAADTAMQLAYDPASGNYPEIPSIIATLTQVS